jgi:DNA repair photolyase
MSRIISASRRTDIPAFQSDEFMSDVRKGYRDLKNPYTGNIDRYLLTPEEVICFVFWTKNPQPMLDKGYLDELTQMGYKFYFNYTITGLKHAHPLLEPGVPDLENQLNSAIQITSKYPETVRWRYDPILFAGNASMEWHATNFIKICRAFNKNAPTITDCIFSFYQDYKKAAIRMRSRNISYSVLTEKGQIETIKELAGYAQEYGIQMFSCAQPLMEKVPEIKQSKCIDADFIAPLLSWDNKYIALMDLKKDKGQRKACGCVQSVDIGVYNTCPHSCAYCYANEGDA